ncbi:MAG: hypothetical protein ACKVU0_12055 [Saprospiraceae bacterium]
MSIRTSIYDFFAYTIPGGLFLLSILGGLELFGLADLWTKIYMSNLVGILIIILCSYVVGHVTSIFNSKWVKLFESRSIPNLAFTEFKVLHPTIQTDINPNDWQIWFASIRRESMELTLEVDKMMATSYLLRGVSMFLALTCFILLLGVVTGKLVWWFLGLAVIVAILSVIAAKGSIKFNKWFYFMIFELIISRNKPYVFAKQESKNENISDESM